MTLTLTKHIFENYQPGSVPKISGTKAMIAYHYGTFDLPAGSYGGCDPDDSLPYIKDIRAKFLRPDPGEILKLPYN